MSVQAGGLIRNPGKNLMVKKIAYAIGSVVIVLAGIRLYIALTEDDVLDPPDVQDSPTA